jgi:hypothetical protein
MSNTYQIGISTTQISLKVDVGTAATCHSAIFIKATTASQTKIMDSVASDNGAIPVTYLGAAKAINGDMVAIQSIADFSALPATVAAEIAADNTTLLKYLPITYTFDGGTAGELAITYNPADCVVSTSGTLVSVVVYVSLIS